MLRLSCVSGLLLVAGLSVQPAFAETPNDVLAALQSEAAKSTPNFSGFSAVRGEKFFTVKHGSDWSCASCHTDNPAVTGKHAKTDKPIDPNKDYMVAGWASVNEGTQGPPVWELVERYIAAEKFVRVVPNSSVKISGV